MTSGLGRESLALEPLIAKGDRRTRSQGDLVLGVVGGQSATKLRDSLRYTPAIRVIVIGDSPSPVRALRSAACARARARG